MLNRPEDEDPLPRPSSVTSSASVLPTSLSSVTGPVPSQSLQSNVSFLPQPSFPSKARSGTTQDPESPPTFSRRTSGLQVESLGTPSSRSPSNSELTGAKNVEPTASAGSMEEVGSMLPPSGNSLNKGGKKRRISSSWSVTRVSTVDPRDLSPEHGAFSLGGEASQPGPASAFSKRSMNPSASRASVAAASLAATSALSTPSDADTSEKEAKDWKISCTVQSAEDFQESQASGRKNRKRKAPAEKNEKGNRAVKHNELYKDTPGKQMVHAKFIWADIPAKYLNKLASQSSSMKPGYFFPRNYIDTDDSDKGDLKLQGLLQGKPPRGDGFDTQQGYRRELSRRSIFVPGQFEKLEDQLVERMIVELKQAFWAYVASLSQEDAESGKEADTTLGGTESANSVKGSEGLVSFAPSQASTSASHHADGMHDQATPIASSLGASSTRGMPAPTSAFSSDPLPAPAVEIGEISCTIDSGTNPEYVVNYNQGRDVDKQLIRAKFTWGKIPEQYLNESGKTKTVDFRPGLYLPFNTLEEEDDAFLGNLILGGKDGRYPELNAQGLKRGTRQSWFNEKEFEEIQGEVVKRMIAALKKAFENYKEELAKEVGTVGKE